jgi:hypothetical protein
LKIVYFLSICYKINKDYSLIDTEFQFRMIKKNILEPYNGDIGTTMGVSNVLELCALHRCFKMVK